MYQILLATGNSTAKTYKFYTSTKLNEDGEIVSEVFETESQDELETELKKIYKNVGTESVLVVQGVTTAIDILFGNESTTPADGTTTDTTDDTTDDGTGNPSTSDGDGDGDGDGGTTGDGGATGDGSGDGSTGD